MSGEIWVAIITSCLSLLGVVITVYYGNKRNEESVKEQTNLTLYRINQLEQKVNKHNNLIERMYRLEDRITLDEEKIKVANHRIQDLEEGVNK